MDSYHSFTSRYQDIANHLSAFQNGINTNNVDHFLVEKIKNEIFTLKNDIKNNTTSSNKNHKKIEFIDKNITKWLEKIDTAVLKQTEKTHSYVTKSLLSKPAQIVNSNDKQETEVKNKKKGYKTESWNLLHHAVVDADLKKIKTLIKTHPEMISMQDLDGLAPLHFASYYGNLEIAKLLMDNGADINQNNNQLSTPLHLATQQGNYACVEYLISKKAQVNASNYLGLTPLHVACSENNLNILGLLVSNGANIEAKSHKGNTPLISAVLNSKFKFCKYLIEKGADVNGSENKDITPLDICAAQGDINLCKLLLENKADVESGNKKANSALCAAAANGHAEICQMLINYKADMTKGADGNTPLHLAVLNEQRDVGEVLMKNGAVANCMNDDGITPLDLAIWKGNLQIFKLFGDTINEKNKNGNTSLHLAASRGKLEICKWLISEGAEIDEKNTLSMTPLVFAMKNKHFDIVHLLIENGADPYITNDDDLDFFALITNIKNQKSNNLYVKISKKHPRLKEQAKEYQQRKLINHLTDSHLEKTDLGKIKNITLEGWAKTPVYLWNKIHKNLSKFNETFPDLMDEDTVKLIQEVFKNKIDNPEDDSNKLYLDWKSGKPVLPNFGFDGHAIGVVFWEDQCIFCNRGAYRALTPVRSFTFNKESLTKEFFENLIKVNTFSGQQYVEYMNNTFYKELMCNKTEDNKLLDKLPLSWQGSGSCAWLNTIGLVLPLQVLHNSKFKNEEMNSLKEIMDKQIKAYEHFYSFIMIETLEKYMEKSSKRSASSDYRPLAIAFAKHYPNNTMDKALIAKWENGRKDFLKLAPSRDQITYAALSWKKYLWGN